MFSTAQTFYVVDCGASGHNIRAQPSLKALPVGKLKLGSSFLVTEQVFWGILIIKTRVAILKKLYRVNLRRERGLKLLPTSVRQYCSNNDLEAWSLAVDRHQMVYLRHEDEVLSGNLVA